MGQNFLTYPQFYVHAWTTADLKPISYNPRYPENVVTSTNTFQGKLI